MAVAPLSPVRTRSDDDTHDGATLSETGPDEGSRAPEGAPRPAPSRAARTHPNLVSIGSPERVLRTLSARSAGETPLRGVDTPAAGGAAVALRWVLPGHGESYVRCGAWVSSVHLTPSGARHVVPYRDSCRRFDCPVCFRDWAAREAGRIEDRAALGILKSRRHRAIHVVVAPPPELWHLADDLDGYRTLRALAYKEGEARGLDGGVWVYHHYRVGDRWDNNRDGLCAVGPHFHVLGDGWITSHPGAWIVKNLGVRESVFDTAYYLLTHAPRAAAEGNSPQDNLSKVHRAVQTVTWAQEWSYSRLVAPKPLRDAIPVRFCPLCRRLLPVVEWHDAHWAGSGPPPTEPHVDERGEWRA
jgi:hypothetical protein